MAAIGIDIGGSGIKAACVDLHSGRLLGRRITIATPQPATPEAVAKELCGLIRRLESVYQAQMPTAQPLDQTVGVAVPAPVLDGRLPFMANLDAQWTQIVAQDFLREQLQRPVKLLNDADAAGLAEVRFGAARDTPGVILVTTLGTGIGSALFCDGVLIPNTEFGHLRLPNGMEAEHYASARVKTDYRLSFSRWAERLQEVYEYLDLLLRPDVVVIGGGISKRSDKFLPLLNLRPTVVPAQLFNDAGIVGVAQFAACAATVSPTS